MAELNLLEKYPTSKRNLDERQDRVDDSVREVSRRYGKDYFDGDRIFGYGGYNYHPRFWTDTVRHIAQHYGLSQDARILDVGCAKGFMLYDFKLLMPDATIGGIDISQYAYDNAMESVKPFLRVGDAKSLPYDDDSFDLVLGLSTIHNLPLDECKEALREIQRVSAKNAFVTVDAWRTDAERERLERWVVTARTYMHVDDWVSLFAETGYTGDYYWFIP